jgi:hypothetical protein
MSEEFEAGYPADLHPLLSDFPGPDVYPPADFRVEWGPVFHRGRLDGSARVLVIGQDPAAHEAVVRRILVGEAGQRVQGFLHKLGVDTSYVMVNTFLYSVFGQGGGERHADDPAIAAYRNRWLDTLIVGRSVEVVLALGLLAERAFGQWRATPSGAAAPVTFRAITHPTFPESSSSSGQTTKAEAMRQMLARWNEALEALEGVATPDTPRPLVRYGERLTPADLAPIPALDLPPGVPPWMRALDAWARRAATGRAAAPTATAAERNEGKRATIVVEVPRSARVWRTG